MHRSLALACAALLLITTVHGAAAAPEGNATAGPPEVDLSQRPFVIFAPAPPKPRAIDDYPLPDGADDYWRLWEDDAPWQDAAAHLGAFAISAWAVRYFATDAQLQRMIAWLDEHDIPLGLEVEPLTWPGPEVCDHTESFEGPYDLEAARRIRDLGGTVALVSLDEPFANASMQSGPGACGYPVEQVVDEVADFVRRLRAIHPGVVVGSIEPIISDPHLTPDDVARWLDTYAERTGEPFAFLTVDLDWRRETWPIEARAIEAVADSRGVPFGILYLGDASQQDHARWLSQAAHNMAIFEEEHGGTPDFVGIYSWHEKPDRLLPDDDPDGYASMINRYFGVRTSLAEPSVAARGIAVTGRLTTKDGLPLEGEQVMATVEPIGRARQLHAVNGNVPGGANRALIAVRANAEGGQPSRVDVRIERVRYEQDGDGVNRVPNAAFKRGLEGWGAYGMGSVRVQRGVLRVQGSPRQEIFVDGSSFRVTPGASYDFSAVLDVPEDSVGAGYVSLIFLGEQEVGRQNLWFRPMPIELEPVTTDVDGGFMVGTAALDPGRYAVTIDYEGDAGHWAARSSTSLRRK